MMSRKKIFETSPYFSKLFSEIRLFIFSFQVCNPLER